MYTTNNAATLSLPLRTDYYDADAVAAVQKAFRWELEYFGYQLG